MSDATSGLPSFGPVARVYDDLMHNVPYDMWADYYLLLLAHQGVEPKSLLDVCCGTGTLARMFTESGYRVAGFDLSAGMIEVARAKAHRHGLNIRFEQADAAEVELGETFDGAYSFFDSLNYITEVESLRRAIHRVSAHLLAGGSFIFDLNTAYAFEARMFDQRNMNARARVRYDWRGDWDPETRLIHVHMTFWAAGEEFREVHIQRAHSDEEIRAMLAEAGFGAVQCFHSYTLDRPRATSDRVHYTAIKA